MANERPGGKRLDQATQTETVGHEWDGIEELDTPMPRWWLWTYYASIVFAIGYVVVYPAIPLLNKGTEGIWGWTSRGQLAEEMAREEARNAPIMAALAQIPIERLPEDRNRMRAAIEGGEAAFKVNCVQCHGAGAAGSKGYPNLNDDDWLWGGDLKVIAYTVENGIRHPGDDETHFSLMPSFGRDGLLSSAEIDDVVSFVLTLSGTEKMSASTHRGGAIYETNCAICHAPDGTGLRGFGAPNLADAISLFGNSRAAIREQIYAPSHGVMPAWGDRLDPVTIKMLAAYVHSLGGGEYSIEADEGPAAEAHEQP